MQDRDVPESTKPANAVDRLIALLIDYLSIGALFFLTLALIFVIVFLLDSVRQGFGSANSGHIALTFFSCYLILAFIYYSQINRRSAQTIGERIMKIQMIPIEKKRIGVRVAVWRIFFFLVPLLGLVSIYYAYVNKGQSFLDNLCRTATIKERS